MAVHHPLAFCPSHGVFAAKAFALDNVTNVKFQNCAVTCPQCGRDSMIFSGAYSTKGDQLNLLLDKGIPTNALIALRDLANRLQDEDVSAQDAKSEAAKINPKFGKLFDVSEWSPEVKAALIASIIAASSALLNSKDTTVFVAPQVHIERQVAPPTLPGLDEYLRKRRDQRV